LGIAAVDALSGRKLEPLRDAGRDIANLLPASLILLIVSGLVEGFISPLSGPYVVYAKVVLGSALFVAALAWLCGWFRPGGR
ncbi:MAG: hypothetical protein NZ934_04855, partial [Hadesarchaea archaeon]|nr:hypothetical protein [Hadesarchaea archaeon]